MAKILIIDDDEDVTTLFSFRLNKDGHVCDVAPSAQEALEKASGGGFDLIIVDRLLPDKTGEEVAAHLKEDVKTQRTPIIMVSGAEMTEKNADIDLFLLKPFEWNVLQEGIKKLLKK